MSIRSNLAESNIFVPNFIVFFLFYLVHTLSAIDAQTKYEMIEITTGFFHNWTDGVIFFYLFKFILSNRYYTVFGVDGVALNLFFSFIAHLVLVVKLRSIV